eukprot:Cvel_14170.t1-p1 / transcript=Cvel_14170.t1 / gene=Cvel_14170 / organism=Chromera_velia_CCMP2878 / gene_product=hypothetical protein / transcript_product=hypothetical protein / location=Cvel_scaffold998:57738-59150(+) / protein_length=418 / sequence_SO=supercontig / SO=protein_coding / is_pseudo=false
MPAKRTSPGKTGSVPVGVVVEKSDMSKKHQHFLKQILEHLVQLRENPEGKKSQESLPDKTLAEEFKRVLDHKFLPDWTVLMGRSMGFAAKYRKGYLLLARLRDDWRVLCYKSPLYEAWSQDLAALPRHLDPVPPGSEEGVRIDSVSPTETETTSLIDKVGGGGADSQPSDGDAVMRSGGVGQRAAEILKRLCASDRVYRGVQSSTLETDVVSLSEKEGTGTGGATDPSAAAREGVSEKVPLGSEDLAHLFRKHLTRHCGAVWHVVVGDFVVAPPSGRVCCVEGRLSKDLSGGTGRGSKKDKEGETRRRSPGKGGPRGEGEGCSRVIVFQHRQKEERRVEEFVRDWAYAISLPVLCLVFIGRKSLCSPGSVRGSVTKLVDGEAGSSFAETGFVSEEPVLTAPPAEKSVLVEGVLDVART